MHKNKQGRSFGKSLNLYLLPIEDPSFPLQSLDSFDNCCRRVYRMQDGAGTNYGAFKNDQRMQVDRFSGNKILVSNSQSQDSHQENQHCDFWGRAGAATIVCFVSIQFSHGILGFGKILEVFHLPLATHCRLRGGCVCAKGPRPRTVFPGFPAVTGSVFRVLEGDFDFHQVHLWRVTAPRGHPEEGNRLVEIKTNPGKSKRVLSCCFPKLFLHMSCEADYLKRRAATAPIASVVMSLGNARARSGPLFSHSLSECFIAAVSKRENEFGK